MAVTITPDLTVINAADSTTNWVGTKIVAVDTEFYREASGSVSSTLKNSGTNNYVGYGMSSTDLSSNHLRIWFNTAIASYLDTKANGGIRMYISDGSNTGQWYVAGNDTYGGGWKQFVMYTETPFDTSTGTVTKTAITQVGMRLNLTGLPKNQVNTWVDVISYGPGLIITGGTTGDRGTFAEIEAYDQSTATGRALGVVEYIDGVYHIAGSLVFGDASGTSTTYFEDSNVSIMFSDQLVSTTLYKIQVVGNSTGTNHFQLGTPVGTGSNTIGTESVVIASAGPNWFFNANDADSDAINLYSVTMSNATTIEFGDGTTSPDGGAVEIVDCTFNDVTEVLRDIDDTSNDPLMIRNKITSATDTVASLDMIDGIDTDSDEWQIIQGDGFQSTATGSQTLTISNHNFNLMTKPYITITDDEVWNVINPSWTITDQTELDFVIVSANSEIVNEKYSLDLKVQQPDGTVIQTARTYVYEGTQNQDLPSENQQATDASGEVSSNILKTTYTDGGGSTLTTTSYGNFALKIYYHGRTPFVGALTVTAAINQSITLVTDPGINETTQATAITAGSGIAVENPTNPTTLLTYDNGTVDFTVGETVTGNSSGADGVVVEVAEGDTVSGRIYLDTRDAVANFTDNEQLNGSIGGSNMALVDKAAADGQLNFAWHVDCNSLSLQVVYDYLAARMAEDPSTQPAIFETAIIWGEDEQSQLLYSGASGYFTERNVNLTEGVYLSNKGAGTIDYMTDDGGTTYTPPSDITLTVDGVVQNTQCYIVPSAGGSAILNAAATSAVSGDEYSTSTSYTYTSDVDITISAREMGYLPYQASSTITNNDVTFTPVWQIDPNWKLVVSGINISFTNPSTITRASGSFVTDGWLDIMGQVTVSGSTSNDDTYTISAVAATTLTITGGTVSTAGAAAGITLTYTRRAPTW